MDELPSGGTGNLAAGRTGPLRLPDQPAGTGRLDPAVPLPRAYANDRVSAHGLGDGGFSPSQMNFALARPGAAPAGTPPADGLDLVELEALLDDLDRRLDVLHGGREQSEGSPDDPDEE